MIPSVDSIVKCFLRNTTVLEGKVVEWGDTQVVLKSLDEQSLLIVHRPNEDILLTKVVLVPEKLLEKPKEKKLSELQQKIKEKLYEVQQPFSIENSSINEKNIKELQQMIIEQDKQIIEEKRKEHFGTAGNSKVKKYSQQFAYIQKKLPLIEDKSREVISNGNIRFYKE